MQHLSRIPAILRRPLHIPRSLGPNCAKHIFTNLTRVSRHLHATSDLIILGIESSCDDTGVAVVTSDGRILGESLATQADIHAAWGGVVPKLAQQAHTSAIDGCIHQALSLSNVSPSDLSAVAVTIGPGLSLCLRVGVLAARRLAATHNLPLIPIHHMEAHALVARLPPSSSSSNQHSREEDDGKNTEHHGGYNTFSNQQQFQPQFPFLCLLVSGGHNLLVIVEGVGKYIQLGTTLDDAIGEAYDKVARLVGLTPIPSGGAALEQLALHGDPRSIPLTIPLRKRKTCDFSYAGLKTAVRLATEQHLPSASPVEGGGGGGGGLVDVETILSKEDSQIRANIAASFQEAAVVHLEERVTRALSWALDTHPDIKHLVVAGGVAANKVVRRRLGAVAEGVGVELVCPPGKLCTDNGVMVAWAGLEKVMAPGGEGLLVMMMEQKEEEEEEEWVDLRPRWPLTEKRDARCDALSTRSAKKVRIFPALDK